MKTKIIFLVALASLLTLVSCEPSKWNDDRLVEHPYQDSVLNDMIQRSKHRSDLYRNPDRDTTFYHVGFFFYTWKDSAKVSVLGEYCPLIFMDSIWKDEFRLLGYFRRENVYCYFYELRYSERTPVAVDLLLKDWKYKTHFDGKDPFPVEQIGYWSEFVYKYNIDSLGNATLIGRRRW